MTERLSDLPTPCLVLERSRLASNIERMADRARTLGVALRPHLKTCKSVDIAAMVAPERSRVTVSTLREARYFAAAGFSDLLYAVGIAPQKLAEVNALNGQGARVQLLLDGTDSTTATTILGYAGATVAEVGGRRSAGGRIESCCAGLEPGRISPLAAEAMAEIGLDARTSVVTLTHDPKLDDPAIEAALAQDVAAVDLDLDGSHHVRLGACWITQEEREPSHPGHGGRLIGLLLERNLVVIERTLEVAFLEVPVRERDPHAGNIRVLSDDSFHLFDGDGPGNHRTGFRGIHHSVAGRPGAGGDRRLCRNAWHGI